MPIIDSNKENRHMIYSVAIRTLEPESEYSIKFVPLIRAFRVGEAYSKKTLLDAFHSFWKGRTEVERFILEAIHIENEFFRFQFGSLLIDALEPKRFFINIPTRRIENYISSDTQESHEHHV